jgi:hypothetical protein
VRWNNEHVTAYRAHPTQKYPYLYPLAGPLSGRSLTVETALPWPHHRSCFFGCDRVNGGNYWQEGPEQGQIRSRGPRLGAIQSDAVEILDACDWQRPNTPIVMRDERRVVVRIVGPQLRFVDWEIRWLAVEHITIEKTNHSLFAVRVAPDLSPAGGGRLVNADGQSGEKATFGVNSAWCDCSRGGGATAGVAAEGLTLMDHPRNPWAPTPWFTRDYGFMSPTPLYFREQPWTLAGGDSVTLRYRVVLHGGDVGASDLDAIFRAWSRA